MDEEIIDKALKKTWEYLHLELNVALYEMKPIILLVYFGFSIFISFVIYLDEGSLTFGDFIKIAILVIITLTAFGALIAYMLFGRAYFHKVKMIRNCKSHYRKICELIKLNNSFVFYLCDFQSGLEQVEIPEVPGAKSKFGPYFIYGNSRREVISRNLNSFIPVVFLFNAKELNPKYTGYSLIVDDENWIYFFKELYHYSKYVVVDYGKNFHTSLHIQYEIEHIVNQGCNKVLFCGTDSELVSLEQKYPKMEERIIDSFQIQDGFGGLTLSDSDKLFDKIKNNEFSKIP